MNAQKESVRIVKKSEHRKEESNFSDLEIKKLDELFANFVKQSSFTLIIITLLLYIISPKFFDRLQYEDGYVENLTVILLLIALTGIVKYLFSKVNRKNIKNFHYSFIILQILGFFFVSLYACLQELEFGQRAFDYEMSEGTKDITKGNGMNLHHRPGMEIFLAFGAILFSFYTAIIPHILREPISNRLSVKVKKNISPLILKIPRSLVPAFLSGIFLALIQEVSFLFTEELEEFNEYSEVCFAYALALLGIYLWKSTKIEGQI